MVKGENFTVEGEIVETLPNALFRVEITDPGNKRPDLKGKTVLCHLSGKMRRYYIKVMPGDKVKLEMTPYDMDKGRIVYRYK